MKWYFVCRCDAKFFAPMRIVRCPRCGAEGVSLERMTPPWVRKEKVMFKILASATGTCDVTGKEGEGVRVEDERGGNAFLSWKALRQQVEFETKKRNGKDAPAMERNGEPVS